MNDRLSRKIGGFMTVFFRPWDYTSNIKMPSLDTFIPARLRPIFDRAALFISPIKDFLPNRSVIILSGIGVTILFIVWKIHNSKNDNTPNPSKKPTPNTGIGSEFRLTSPLSGTMPTPSPDQAAPSQHTGASSTVVPHAKRQLQYPANLPKVTNMLESKPDSSQVRQEGGTNSELAGQPEIPQDLTQSQIAAHTTPPLNTPNQNESIVPNAPTKLPLSNNLDGQGETPHQIMDEKATEEMWWITSVVKSWIQKISSPCQRSCSRKKL